LVWHIGVRQYTKSNGEGGGRFSGQIPDNVPGCRKGDFIRITLQSNAIMDIFQTIETLLISCINNIQIVAERKTRFFVRIKENENYNLWNYWLALRIQI